MKISSSCSLSRRQHSLVTLLLLLALLTTQPLIVVHSTSSDTINPVTSFSPPARMNKLLNSILSLLQSTQIVTKNKPPIIPISSPTAPHSSKLLTSPQHRKPSPKSPANLKNRVTKKSTTTENQSTIPISTNSTIDLWTSAWSCSDGFAKYYSKLLFQYIYSHHT